MLVMDMFCFVVGIKSLDRLLALKLLLFQNFYVVPHQNSEDGRVFGFPTAKVPDQLGKKKSPMLRMSTCLAMSRY
jgi:hypothetical protein